MESKNEFLSLGDLIINIRRKKGYSQRKFAQISGLSNTTISRIENSETLHPDYETLKLLAKHLDIDLEHLIRIVDSSKKQKQSVRHAKLNYYQKPIRKIKRYSSVFSHTQQIHELTQEEPNLQKSKDENYTKPTKKINLKGMRLITLRLEKNITQKELADALGIDKTLISQYEGEIIKPDYDIIERLAEYLGVTIEYLSGAPDLPVETNIQPNESILEESIVAKTQQKDLRPEYIQVAKELQNAGIDPKDVKAFIDMIKKYKGNG